MLSGSAPPRSGAAVGDERVADVAERAVDRLHEQMDGRRLARAGDDERFALVRDEVGGGIRSATRPDPGNGCAASAGNAAMSR